ncbi:MAG: hypothetical protein RLZZ367_917 [Bacteroidota bacterium]|jgi:hypothetical protein
MKLKMFIQRIITAMLLLSVAFSVQAQQWNRTYIVDRPVLLFSSILEEDNNYYITGVTTDKGNFTNFDRAFIGKLDEFGNVSQYKTITDSAGKVYSAYFNTLIKDSHGKLVFTGYSIDSVSRLLLVKTDESFSDIQVYEYTTPNTSAFQGRSMLQHNDYYYVTGVRTVQSTNNASVVLLKIDTNGNRLWEKLYNQDKIDYAESIISLSNGNLMLGAYRTNINQTNEIANTWLLEVDTGGMVQRQWFDSNDSTYVARGLLQTQDGGVIYCGQKKYIQIGTTIGYTGTVTKMDTSFNIQWVYNNGYRSIYTGITDVELLPGGSIIVCGQKQIYNTDTTILSGWIVKLDVGGTVVWESAYTAINQSLVKNFLTDIDVLSDGSLIAVGQCQIPGQMPPQVGWFLKLDSNGCEIGNCMVGLPDDELSVADDGQIHVYPNPFTSDVSISFVDMHVSTATFTITNHIGQIVYQQQETNLATGYTKMLDLSYLPNGVYFVEVETSDGKAVQRIVKQ